MEGSRFDGIVRAFGARLSRRAGLAGVGAALAAALAGAAADAGADGARRKRARTEGPCGDGSRKDNTCTKDKDCCTGICNGGAGKKNRDGRGRCRCLKRGKACKANRNCCNSMQCTNGVCGHEGGNTPKPSGCKSASDCGANADTCTNGVCTCGGGAACDAGAVCDAGKCIVPNGGACVDGVSTCQDDAATCIPYQSWAEGPEGTYCLLAEEALCSKSAECDVNSCYRGVCTPCSCAACASVDCSSPTVKSSDTIQAAIDAAKSGDVITIESGTYTEDLVIPAGKNLTLVGCVEGGDPVTLINASPGKRTIDGSAGWTTLDLIDITVEADNDPSNSVKGGGITQTGALGLCGYTSVTGGYSRYGGGVYVYGDSSLTRANVLVTDNVEISGNKSSESGGGLYLDSYTDGILSRVAAINDNVAPRNSSWGGGGIFVGRKATLVVRGYPQISFNDAQLGGGIRVDGWPNITQEVTRLTLQGDTDISSNNATMGGGVYLSLANGAPGFDVVTIEDGVTIVDNIADEKGGGFFSDGAHITFSGDVEITGNRAGKTAGTGIGGGVFLGGKEQIVKISGDVLIDNNTADSYGGGIYHGLGTLELSGNVVVSNNKASGSSYGGGGVMISGSGAVMTMKDAATITKNTAPNGKGGGIYQDQPSTVTLEGTATITENSATDGGGIYAGGGAMTLTAPAGSISSNTPDNCDGNSLTC